MNSNFYTLELMAREIYTEKHVQANKNRRWLKARNLARRAR